MIFKHGNTATMSNGFGKRTASARGSNIDMDRFSMPDMAARGSVYSSRKAKSSGAGNKDVKLQQLAMLSLGPVLRSIQHWWLQRAERHYLICADVEQQRAREAQMNVAYYQKRAALARSARI